MYLNLDICLNIDAYLIFNINIAFQFKALLIEGNMKIHHLALTGLLAATVTPTVYAEDMLTGKVKLACEAILCLSTGSPPGECSPSLSEYFSIDFDDFGDTIRERINFLDLCPVAAETPQMRSLVNAIANGAGRCDAASLNATLVTYTGAGNNFMSGIGSGCIQGTKPAYCTTYETHEYTDLGGGAKYIVDPPTTGYWPYSPILNGGNGNFMGFNTGISGYSTPRSCGHWVN